MKNGKHFGKLIMKNTVLQKCRLNGKNCGKMIFAKRQKTTANIKSVTRLKNLYYKLAYLQMKLKNCSGYYLGNFWKNSYFLASGHTGNIVLENVT